jgi:hypothetical protein
MPDQIIFADIFEAVRHLESSNPILNLKDRKTGHLIRNLYFNIMEMPNGTIGAFPPNMFLRFYRGENGDYDLKYPCVPSIYRVRKPDERDAEGNRNAELILIDNLKVTEFELVLKEFPQVKFAIKDYCDVDYRALAQHYEMNTDLLDVTSDIAVAAFFATHVYDAAAKDFRVREDGVGCIRSYVYMMLEPDKIEPFRMIGLQPFQRPGLQCAFAVRMGKGENFSKLSSKILFKQDAKWNRKIHEAFYPHGRNILFPMEEISDVAALIKNNDSISKMSVEKYCKENGCKIEEIEVILMKHNIKVIDNLAYSLSRQQRRKLEREYKGKPYGDVKLYSRLTYIPPGD